eukprot:scaffold1103_cov91-Isochrysis_galbana.AAC.1
MVTVSICLVGLATFPNPTPLHASVRCRACAARRNRPTLRYYRYLERYRGAQQSNQKRSVTRLHPTSDVAQHAYVICGGAYAYVALRVAYKYHMLVARL